MTTDPTPTPPQRWGCFSLFLLPFLLAWLFLGCVKLDELGAARGLALYEPRGDLAGPDGPVLLSGRLARPAGAAPGGSTAVAWFATKKERKGKSYSTLCQEQRVEPFELRLAAGSVALDPLLASGVQWAYTGASGEGERLLVSAGALVDSKPGDPSKQAPGLPLPCPVDEHRDAYYEYRVLREGEEVQVMACKQGDRLRRCDRATIAQACRRDGLPLSCHVQDAIFTGPVADRHSPRLQVGFFELWTSLVLCFVFAMLSLALPGLPPDRGES